MNASSFTGTEGFGARSLTPVYLTVGLVAGAVIALQISIMRIFAVGSWAHFGSLVVSLAMLGFGLSSAVMCVFPKWFERHWRILSSLALLAFGPLAVASNLIAQQFPFNAIYLVSDPMQKWRLALNFLLYRTPFLAGALFLGVVFQRAQTIFNRVYFADLVGSGICGLLLLSMYALRPQDLIAVPLVLWAVGSLLWFLALGNRGGAMQIAGVATLALAAHFVLPGMLGVPKIAISDYKGVSYARKFPDSQRILERTSPFGYPEWTLFFEFHESPLGVQEQAETTQGICAEHGGSGFEWFANPEDCTRLWQARHNAYHACLQLQAGARILNTDICVPISKLAFCIDRARDMLGKSHLKSAILGHVGDGNYHALIIIDPNRPEDMQEAERLNHCIVQDALSVGGTCTGEHGVGMHKIQFMLQEHGADAIECMRAIKEVFDPNTIMNPGKMLPARLP